MGALGSVGRSFSVWTSLKTSASHSLIVRQSAATTCIEVGCPAIVVCTLCLVLRLTGLSVVMGSLIAIHCDLMYGWPTICERIRVIDSLFVPQLLLVVTVLTPIP
eukprot:Gb_12349 [translate_table: standard]